MLRGFFAAQPCRLWGAGWGDPTLFFSLYAVLLPFQGFFCIIRLFCTCKVFVQQGFEIHSAIKVFFKTLFSSKHFLCSREKILKVKMVLHKHCFVLLVFQKLNTVDCIIVRQANCLAVPGRMFSATVRQVTQNIAQFNTFCNHSFNFKSVSQILQFPD